MDKLIYEIIVKRDVGIREYGSPNYKVIYRREFNEWNWEAMYENIRKLYPNDIVLVNALDVYGDFIRTIV